MGAFRAHRSLGSGSDSYNPPCRALSERSHGVAPKDHELAFRLSIHFPAIKVAGYEMVLEICVDTQPEMDVLSDGDHRCEHEM